jgi:hypothetical protein
MRLRPGYFRELISVNERESKPRRRLASKIAVVILGAAASLTGTYYLIVNKHNASFDGNAISRAINTTITIQPSAGRGQDEKSDKDAIGPDVTEPRNVFLFNNEFKLEVMRATTDAPTPKKQFRDKVLGVIEALVSSLAAGEPGENQLQDLGKSLGTIIGDAPISSYQLTRGEFTLRPGTAYFLPGGGNSLALLGPYGADRPDAIYVRRNGRKVPMSIGSVRIFKIDGRTCTLMLHDVAHNYASATFSFSCGES